MALLIGTARRGGRRKPVGLSNLSDICKWSSPDAVIAGHAVYCQAVSSILGDSWKAVNRDWWEIFLMVII